MTYRFLFIIIMMIAAALRIWAIGFGLPYFEHPDEWAVADEALRMLKTGNFSPFSYTYPTLYIYAQVGVAALHYAWGMATGLYKHMSDIEQTQYYIWARMFTALLGVGSVALTALIGRRLYSRAVGLMAAALFAVMPAATGDAHYVTVDTPSAFMALLAFWSIVRMVQSSQRLSVEEEKRLFTTKTPRRKDQNFSDKTSAEFKANNRLEKDSYLAHVRLGNLVSSCLGGKGAFDQNQLLRPILPWLGSKGALSASTSIQPSNRLESGSSHARLGNLVSSWLGGKGTFDQNQLLRPILPGLLLGLAASTKYTCGIVMIALLTACLMLAWKSRATTATRLQLAAWLMLVAGAAAAFGFSLGTPMWLLEPQHLLADLAAIARHYRTGHPGAEASQPALFYWNVLSQQAVLLAWLFLAGLILAVIRRRQADILLLAVIVPFVLQLSSVRVVFVRNAIPLLPFVILLAAAFVAWLIQLLDRRIASSQASIDRTPQTKQQSNSQGSDYQQSAIGYRLSAIGYRLLVIITIILALQPLRIAAHDEWLRAQPTTRILATEWVEQHAADGSRIWLEDQTLILPARLRVAGGQPASSHPLQWYRDNGFRYLVTNASIARSDPAVLASFGQPVASFEAQERRHGHSFVIYDLGENAAVNQPRSPSGATLGAGALTLEGYNHLAQIKAGESLSLALFWQVNRSLPANYTVFVHLLDAQGNKLAQRDTPPLDGSRPTLSWQPGELLRDDQDLPIPAGISPGIYKLVVGMYDAQTLVSINDSGPIELGSVEVQ